jgi:hypothetical protein
VKKTALHLALALVLSALQASFMRYVGGGAFSVALLVPVVVYLGFHAPTVEGAVGAALCGWVLDAMAGGPAGLLTFLCVVLFLGSRMAGASFDIHGKVGFAAASGVGTLCVGLGALLLTRYVTPEESAPGVPVLLRVLVESAFTAPASLLVLAAMRRIDALFEKEEPGLLR